VKVSVCITAFNHENYIAQALDSVLAQKTNFDFEVLLGEDDSSDKTREISKEYKKKYPDKIKLFLNDRKNVVYVDRIATGRWNFYNNIKNSTGEYIATLDGDDFWTDTLKLQKQVDVLEKNIAAGGCFHETQVIFQDGILGNVYGKIAKETLGVEDTIAQGSPFHTSSFMFRRSFLPDPVPEWFNKVISADMALFMVLASKGPIISIPEVMSYYRKHPGGITEKTRAKKRFHDHRIKLLKYFNYYTDGVYENKINEVIRGHKICKKRLRKEIVRNKISYIRKYLSRSYL
jgi:glycosyltransferase involved in cell wall biosynthesis